MGGLPLQRIMVVLVLNPREDASKLYPHLFASGRCNAAWISVADHITMLVVNMYGISGALSDTAKHAKNNQMFREAMEFVSQHGDIPIALVADFQDLPQSYDSIKEALAKGIFVDVLSAFGGDGVSRPNTFAKVAAKNDSSSDLVTSIDGILLNPCAFQYVSHASVKRCIGLQHAYVETFFNWPGAGESKTSKHFKWIPHAALDTSRVKHFGDRERIATQLWDSKFSALCAAAENSEQMMKLANDFAIETLLESGATWKHGSHERGSMPRLKNFDRISSSMGCDQPNKRLHDIRKALCRIDDIAYKIAQHDRPQHACDIVTVAWRRVMVLLNKLHFGACPDWPTQQTLNEVWVFLAHHHDLEAKQLRINRINEWRAKMKASALSNCSDVYGYLKRKYSTAGHLVNTDANGNPFFHPDDAMDYALQQWNQVFDVNRNHAPPEKVIGVVYEALQKRAVSCELPPLAATHLFDAIQARKATAAPGIDGWRTSEFQLLVPLNFLPWATLWSKVENGEWEIPTIFQVARLVMLPKAGASSLTPGDKRLITLLSLPYLVWSKARFSHLQAWQEQILPKQLSGGIRGRQPADVAHRISAATEAAILQKRSLMGVKLDRAKCFDRILPQTIAALGRSLGLPEQYLRVWLAVYADFKRYLTIGQVLSSVPMKQTNGVSQGDSASVLSVNLLMCGWCELLSSIPEIEYFGYIDDCYIMCDEKFSFNLKQAFEATRLYDELTGQLLNVHKSEGWATTRSAKRKLAEAIPGLKINDCFQVLGTFVKTTRKAKTVPAHSTAHMIRSLVGDVAGLPISLKKKSLVIASKAVSKLLYHPEMVPWPLAVVDGLVTQISVALWGNRPMWKCSHLLYAFCTKPTTCHPHMAISTRVIMNIILRCQKDLAFVHLWSEICKGPRVIARGLMDAFVRACKCLCFHFEPPFSLRIHGREVSFFEVSKSSLHSLCIRAAHETLYSLSVSSPRKDVVEGGSGILDHFVTASPLRAEPWCPSLLDLEVVDGIHTGACPTANRLFKSNILDKPNCRFCGADYEDIRHLACECPVIREQLGTPLQMYDDQPQLPTHGIFQVPQWLFDEAIKPIRWPLPTMWDFSDCSADIWMGIGCANFKHCWSRTFAIAAYDDLGHVIFSFSYGDFVGSIYKATVALLWYICKCTQGQIRIFTKNQQMIDDWTEICRLGQVSVQQAFGGWWNDILASSEGGHRLLILHFNVDQDSASRIRPNPRTLQLAEQQAVVSGALLNGWKQLVALRLAWLCSLTKLISATNQVRHDKEPPPDELQINIGNNSIDLKARFSKWDWDYVWADYTWQMQPGMMTMPKKWAFSEDAWNCTVSFVEKLVWRVDASAATSIHEMSFLFYKAATFTIPTILEINRGHFLSIADWLRHFMRVVKKQGISIHPPAAHYDARRALFSNQAFPSGTFRGCKMGVASASLKEFALFILSLPHGGVSTSSWNRPLASV